MEQVNMVYTWRRRLLWAAALAPVVWIFIVMVSGAFYSFPQTDDFCAFGRLFSHDLYNPLRDVGNLYQTWTGRYSSVFAVALAGWLISVSPSSVYVTYHILLILLILVFLAGCVMAASVVSSSKLVNMAIAGVACVASLTLMPSRLEGVYWLTGAAVYITGIGIFLMLVRLIARDDRSDNGVSLASCSWPSLAFIVLCVGFNELLALSLGELLLLRMIFHAKDVAHRRRNTIYSLVYVISMAITLFAPGNFIRDKASSVPRRELGEAARLTLASLGQFIHGSIIPNASMLLTTFIGMAVFTWAMKPKKAVDWRCLSPIVLVLLSAIPVHLFAYSFLTGEQSPGRIINQCYVMTLIGGCILAAWLGAVASNKAMGVPRQNIAGIALFVLGLMFVASTPFRQVASTIRDFGPVWRSEQLQRLNVLRAGHGQSVVLEPFSPEGQTPPLLQGGDISDDPDYWVNSCMSSLYNVKSVRLQERQ